MVINYTIHKKDMINGNRFFFHNGNVRNKLQRFDKETFA